MEFIRKVCTVFVCLSALLDLWFHCLFYKFTRNKIQRNEEDINGKCVVVTGGADGIGKQCAKEFARKGAVVVIGDKNLENGQRTVDEIQRETGNMNVTILKLDLSEMASVEQFAKKVSADHPKIKILLNNAGIGVSQDENIKTKDGLNIHVAVNYMGHFLLTNLLLDNLKAETKPRIVSMTSTLLFTARLHIDDLNMDKMKFGLQNCYPYSNTKCMLALHTKELAKQTGVNTYALCPGIVRTHIFDDAPTIVGYLLRLSILIGSTSSASEVARNFVLHCALEKSLENESGKTYRFRKHFHSANRKLDSYSERDLCEASSKLVRLDERLARLKNDA